MISSRSCRSSATTTSTCSRSFIFGLPTDTPTTFSATAELAHAARVSFAQFVLLTPFPGTIDFQKWEDSQEEHDRSRRRAAHPPLAAAAKEAAEDLHAASDDVARSRSAQLTQDTWDSFYSLPAIWRRSSFLRSMKGRLAFVLISKLYRQMYANTGIATDSARHVRAGKMARLIAKPCRRLFVAKATA